MPGSPLRCAESAPDDWHILAQHAPRQHRRRISGGAGQRLRRAIGSLATTPPKPSRAPPSETVFPPKWRPRTGASFPRPPPFDGMSTYRTPKKRSLNFPSSDSTDCFLRPTTSNSSRGLTPESVYWFKPPFCPNSVDRMHCGSDDGCRARPRAWIASASSGRDAPRSSKPHKVSLGSGPQTPADGIRHALLI